MLAAVLMAATATAQTPIRKLVLVDHSNERLIDAKTARSIVVDGIPARVWRLYPAAKWGWASQVEGGVTAGGVCVVTARVMVAPLSASRKLLFKPEKMATAFDAMPNATAEQCTQLARDKLKEAVQGVVSSLVKST
jgi:hypothetical protein